ncbi:hypothetical protein ABFS82_05G098100 [Erythranthe guttata]|nr:PREDICTED: uncharacterized protein LOC105966373 [Erythranthe guttata]|eukprot:XP_012846388.1 PREDICTED: uncharacterized protein LOC105966373 [Erythranthe guttata]
MDSRLIKPRASLPKALLLKDYLLDDLSSCSSNGFKSFPRKQCCTTSTVRFLIEMELKNKQQPQRIKTPSFDTSPSCLLRNPSRSALSALQSVIAAVKRLPFVGGGAEKKRLRQPILPRSLSMKILRKSGFWKRKSNQKEIQRWKSFDQLLKEDAHPSQPSDIVSSESTTAISRCNSSSPVNLNLPEVKNDVVSMESTTGTGSSDSSASTHSSTKQPEQWSSVNEEKEQFSPVSVLDRPFEEDDDEVSSPFQHELPRTQGTKNKVVEKNIQRFGCIAKLEPVNLAKRFTLLPNSENESNSKAIPDIQEEEEDEGEKIEKRVLVLLNKMGPLPSNELKVIKADKLFSDFFREKIMSRNVQCSNSSFDEELLEEAENWVEGSKPRELYLGWEVPKNREVYIKDIEKRGEWKSLCEENREVALELEDEVFAAMLNELLLDISS